MYLKKNILTTFSFDLVNENDTSKHMAYLASKNSSGHDGISLKLSKFLAPALVKPLTLIINQSLITGIFPTKLKIAKVLPYFKKDDIMLMDNYRPISLLTSISKVFEKVVFNQLYDYFQRNYLFYSSHYGLRKLQSREFAALELTDRILKDIYYKNISLAIFMDLSKAFDTLNHQILLNFACITLWCDLINNSPPAQWQWLQLRGTKLMKWLLFMGNCTLLIFAANIYQPDAHYCLKLRMLYSVIHYSLSRLVSD